MGSSAEELARLVGGVRRARGDRRGRAERVLPERERPAWTSAPIRASWSEVVRAVRGRTSKPLIVKLTPNTADVPACAQAAEGAAPTPSR